MQNLKHQTLAIITCKLGVVELIVPGERKTLLQNQEPLMLGGRGGGGGESRKIELAEMQQKVTWIQQLHVHV